MTPDKKLTVFVYCEGPLQFTASFEEYGFGAMGTTEVEAIQNLARMYETMVRLNGEFSKTPPFPQQPSEHWKQYLKAQLPEGYTLGRVAFEAVKRDPGDWMRLLPATRVEWERAAIAIGLLYEQR